jgi:colicin import membrane protein
LALHRCAAGARCSLALDDDPKRAAAQGATKVMSEQKESSVLFSLKELMSLEEDRIKSEEAEKAASAAAAEKARQDAERAAREAEEARIRAEEERRRMEELRSREEAARLEAIRQAEVEKARVEAEQRARLEAMAAQQQHERSLELMKNDESKKKLRKTLLAIAIAVPVIGVGVGYFAYDSYQKGQAKIQAQEAAARQLEEEKKKIEAQMKEQQSKIDGLLTQLSSAKDEATRLALQKQLEEEREKAKKIPTGTGGPRPAGATGPKPACNCTPGDPLCSCL